MMKVSLITVCFNSGKRIETALRSIVNQSYRNIEYIVIDGVSTDNTLSVLSQYKNNITYLISEPDNGIYDAINKGIAIASGEVIGLLHADDLLENEHTIAEIVKTFEQTNADFVYGDLLYVQEANVDRIVRTWTSGTFKKSSLFCGWMPPHPTVYVRSELFRRFGNYDTTFHIAADYDWMLRLLKHDLKVAYLPQNIVRMRVGGKSNKNAASIKTKMQEDLRALGKNQIGGYLTLICKNLRKLGQFFGRKSATEHFAGNVKH